MLTLAWRVRGLAFCARMQPVEIGDDLPPSIRRANVGRLEVRLAPASTAELCDVPFKSSKRYYIDFLQYTPASSIAMTGSLM